MKSIDLKLDKKEIYRLNDFIEKIISKKDLKIELVLEEVFVNILNYSKCEYVKVNAEYENEILSIEFIDNGTEFNPLLNEKHDFPDTIAETEIGGLGIHLTKTMVDDLFYKYEMGENHLRIIKKIDE